MAFTPLEHMSRYVNPWGIDETPTEAEAIAQLDADVQALGDEHRQIAAMLVRALGDHVWLWHDWPDFIATAERHLAVLDPAPVLPGTKGWGVTTWTSQPSPSRPTP
jgi:hypothetical protein